MENEYQEIDLKELIILILRKWWLFTMLAIIGGGIAYYVTTNYIAPVYEAETTLFIGKEENSVGPVDISLAELQTFNQLIVDYQELADSRMVIEPVINKLQLNMSLSTFRGNLTIATKSDSRFFVVKFKHTNPELASDVANELASQLAIAASDIIEVENISVIDIALVPVFPISPNLKMNMAIAVVLGLMVGVFIIFILELFNNKIVKEDDVESELGISVLGIIPEFNWED